MCKAVHSWGQRTTSFEVLLPSRVISEKLVKYYFGLLHKQVQHLQRTGKSLPLFTMASYSVFFFGVHTQNCSSSVMQWLCLYLLTRAMGASTRCYCATVCTKNALCIICETLILRMSPVVPFSLTVSQ